jgi:hypothetical protein
MRRKETFLKQRADKKLIIRHYGFQALVLFMFAIVLYDSFKHQTPFYYTTLGRAFGAQLAYHPDQSGVILLGNGRDAFVGRALLASLS